MSDHAVAKIVFATVSKGRGRRFVAPVADRLAGWQVTEPAVQQPEVEGKGKARGAAYVHGDLGKQLKRRAPNHNFAIDLQKVHGNANEGWPSRRGADIFS